MRSLPGRTGLPYSRHPPHDLGRAAQARHKATATNATIKVPRTLGANGRTALTLSPAGPRARAVRLADFELFLAASSLPVQAGDRQSINGRAVYSSSSRFSHSRNNRMLCRLAR